MSKNIIEHEMSQLSNNFSIKELENLKDSINEHVYIIQSNYDCEDAWGDYEKQTRAFQEQAQLLKKACEELSMGDSLLVLEANFNTNNHYFFIVSENE